MSAEAIRSAVDALNRGDVDTYAAAFHPDAERGVPGVHEMLPLAVSLEVLRGLQQAFDGFNLDPVLMLESGNYVVARWRATGTHTGTFQGIAPTQHRIDTESCEIYEFRDGRVARSWAYGDPAEVSAQLTSESPS
jgi:predicted ester cyclase